MKQKEKVSIFMLMLACPMIFVVLTRDMLGTRPSFYLEPLQVKNLKFFKDHKCVCNPEIALHNCSSNPPPWCKVSSPYSLPCNSSLHADNISGTITETTVDFFFIHYRFTAFSIVFIGNFSLQYWHNLIHKSQHYSS